VAVLPGFVPVSTRPSRLEVVWLTGRLQDDRPLPPQRLPGNPGVRRQFVFLCRKLDPFSNTAEAIDGSKFKAVKSRDDNPTG
jgi:hypothetical protein